MILLLQIINKLHIGFKVTVILDYLNPNLEIYLDIKINEDPSLAKQFKNKLK